ncbi:MAG: amino acid ABC transporter permease [Firmicutes bacterium]|nr:amino acid ABC transporter permease [Bacillota bacterium]MTI71673.1 amino acid ABC transporter permease [Bacillota bacterium]
MEIEESINKTNNKEGLFKRLFISDSENISTKKRLFNGLLIFLLLVFVFIFSIEKIGYDMRWGAVFKYKHKFILGFKMTFLLSFFSLFTSLIIGSFFTVASRSKFLPLYYLYRFYVAMIRGTPFLVQIYVFFYVIGTAFNLTNRYIMGIIILSLFSGAYVTEIIRSGIEGISKSQLETSDSLGFNTYQKYRYIIIPQVIKKITPPLAGQFLSLVKDSSLLSVIAVNELTKNIQEADSLNFASIENYLLLAGLYMIITIPLSYLSKLLERKFSYEY